MTYLPILPVIADHRKGRHRGGAASEHLRDLRLPGQGRHRRPKLPEFLELSA
ncbi:hypothetical protein [Streptomyces sp. NPDC048643]|uniref:hypothetical protein n=1 Tax=Streptomyces sp. NPDC048643 TaxID=3155637 RepID=UPI00341F2BA5